jgi:calcineurin-like phosphoesterase
VWDQKEIMEYIDKEERLLRPKNLFEPAPGRGLIFIILKMILKLVYLI